MRRPRRPFVNPSNDAESFYDIIEDYELIEASFAQQYGIRLRREDDMSWGEFMTLLAGINSDSALGAIVSIRSETDAERIKNFTPQQKKIRNDWRRNHRPIVRSKEELDSAMNGFKNMFISIGKEG